MIYLIDDTPLPMLERYMNPSDYADVLARLEKFSEEDVMLLYGADCILVHSSFYNPKVKKQLLRFFNNGDDAPIVFFSDGDSPKAEFNGENFIISIKKTVLYSRLPKFLEEFRETHEVNLRTLASDTPQKSKEVAASQDGGNVFKDFFSKYNIALAPETDKRIAGPRIYLVGRNGMDKLSRDVDGEFVPLSASAIRDSKVRKQDAKIHDFLSDIFAEEVKALVLDTDADPLLYMRMALHFRLTETLPGKSKYAPIVFVSDFSLEKLLKCGTDSQIFLTKGVYVCKRGELAEKLPSYADLEETSFREGFLDTVTIPAPEGSNHSLANQWGASRLYMLIKGPDAEKDVFKGFQDIHKDLYFKYVFHRLPPSEPSAPPVREEYKVKGCTGKHILLIDDEARKGWTRTLSLLFPMARFNPDVDVISEEFVSDYESLSENARQKIETGNYDLILLDLRLGGVHEDYIVRPEDMSGYKVLQRIKEINRGTQVIMLTASNKAWNLKALMRPPLGADGYFVKESPEYEFSDELSKENLKSLIADAERCLRQSYLRDYWDFVRRFETTEDRLGQVVYKQLSMAYDMAARADSPESYEYAFFALYQVVEMVTSRLIDGVTNTDNPDMQLMRIDGNEYVREIVYPKEAEVITRQKPMAFYTTHKNARFPQKDKFAALYLQKWEKQERGLVFIMTQLIEIRNAFVHPENGEEFKPVSPIRETSLPQDYFSNASLILSHPDFKQLFREAARNGCLYADADGRPVLHKDIAKSSLGIRFLLACFNDFLPSILS